MKLVTAAQMRELDRQTIDDDGVPQQVLMERAGAGVAAVVRERFPHPCRIVCMVGKGNNGGDAQVAARILEKQGYSCTLCPTFDAESFDGADVIIDGLLGIGARAPLSPELVNYITWVNALQKPIVAIDIPSGLDADTGTSCGAIITAAVTVTMAQPKLGLFLGDGPNHCGDIVVVDIGISPTRVVAAAIRRDLVTLSHVAPFFPERPKTAHKGNFGHVLIVAGATDKMGAGLLAAHGVLRSGAGLVTYAIPETAFQKFDTSLPEVMMAPVPDKGTGHWHSAGIPKLDELIKGKTAIVVGPGIGTAVETVKVVAHLLEKTTLPLVIDADALNAIAAHPDLMRFLSERCILTPHPGEMGRLTATSSDAVQTRRLTAAEDFAIAHPSIMVLKGARTLTATPTQTWINLTGNPNMASAGMGDVLAGVIGGLLAQSFTPESAAYCGVFIHGLAGDLVAGQGLLASDVANAIPRAIQTVQVGLVKPIPILQPKV
jgi:NAD(P)H-hydrate epimerase